jgi:uncharacterized protein involved in outer membrane biogenesis
MLRKVKHLSQHVSSTQIRILGWSFFVAFFVTVALPLLFFFYLFNPDNVRKMILEQVNTKQYTVKINGDIVPKTWHGLTLFVADTSIYDNKTFKEVVHINEASYQLSWPSLILGKYSIKRISLVGVSVTRNSDSNYANLINYDSLKQSEFSSLKYVYVSDLGVKDSLGNDVIKNAQLKITQLDKIKPRLDLQLEISKLNSTLTMGGDFVRDSNDLKLDDLLIKLNGSNYYIDAQAKSNYDFDKQTFFVNDLNGLISLPEYTGSFSIDAASVDLDKLNVSKLTAKINTRDSVYGQFASIVANNLVTNDYVNFVTDNLSMNVNAVYQDHDINATIGAKKFHFNDKFDINNQKIDVVYNASCAESSLFPNSAILSGYVSNKSESKLAFGQFSGVFMNYPVKFSGDASYDKILPSVNVIANFESLNLSSGIDGNVNLPTYQDNDKLDLTWISKFDLNAKLTASRVEFARLSLNNLSTNVRIKEHKLSVSDFQAKTYGGSINGDILVAESNGLNNISATGKVVGVDLQKVMQDAFNISAITGIANIQLSTNASAVSKYSDLYKNINGNINLNVTNGGFSGVDFNMFLSPENLAAFTDSKSSSTKFNNLNAKFVFKNGVSESGLLNFNSSTINAKGSGDINFADNKIDYDLLIQSILPANAHHVQSVVIPVNVTGDLFKPKIYIKNMKLNKTAIKK